MKERKALDMHLDRRRSRRGRRGGMAAIELALCLPILLTMVVTILDLGRAIEVSQVLANAAREAGRQASIGALSITQINQVVLDNLQNQGISTDNMSLSVFDLTNSGATSASASGGDSLQVTITLPTANVLWIRGITGAIYPTNLTAQTTWCAIRGPN